MQTQCVTTSRSLMRTELISSKKSHAVFILIMTMMSSIGLVSSDIYLPSLANMMKDLSATSVEAKLTITAFLFGISLFQLIYGPLADVFGRKRIILFGMTLYVISSCLCIISTNITFLIVFRIVQAVGACSGIVLGKVLIADLFTKIESAKIYATVFPFVGMSPAISPIIGSNISNYFGWRATFIFCALFGSAIIALSSKFLKETLEKPLKFSTSDIFRHYLKVSTNRLFITYTIAVCSSYCCYFSYIIESPFLLTKLGFSTTQIGFSYISISCMYVLGNILCKQLLGKASQSIDSLMNVGFTFVLSGAGLFLASSLFGINHALQLLVPMSVLALGNGFILPLGSSGAVGSYKHAGFSSASLGFFQLATTALISQMVGIYTRGIPVRLSSCILAISTLGFVFFTVVRRREMVA